MTWPLLKNAPIAEALIDLRTEFAVETSEEAYERFFEQIRARYPSRQRRSEMVTLITAPPPGQTSTSETQHRFAGYVHLSADGGYAVQARRDGFTLSRLRPYESWAALRAEAERVWPEFVAELQPERVTRAAVRYINQIDLRFPSPELKDFFTTYPEVGPQVTTDLAGFLSRLAFAVPAARAHVIVTQATQPIQDGVPRASILLDIDVFRQDVLPTAGSALWPVLDTLRAVKNDVFFGSLTPKALELFQ